MERANAEQAFREGAVINSKYGQVLIDIDNNMSSVSLIEDGRLNEFYVEFSDINLLTSNIYKGRVVNVLQGLQSAFVDIGMPRNAFLYVGETLDDRSDLRKSGVIPGSLDVKEGDYIMVQVTKEETAIKGARLSVNISLPGRYVVYLPTIDFIGVSNKITDPQIRERLSTLLSKNKKGSEGFIARTVCTDAKKSEILNEIKSLKALYADISESFENAKGVSLIHSEGNLLFRTVRDMLNNNVESIICNDLQTVERLKSQFKKTKSRFYGIISHYESDYDMMDVFGVTKELDKLLERKIDLPSGGSIVIDKTEALTAIDVNTGRFKGSGNHEETVFITNMEAAREIARQIRLRNIGGIIVVDFIDMVLSEHCGEVVETLKKEVLHDRIKTRVLEMTELGLVQITRKKVGCELSEFLNGVCPHCKGNAHTQSPIYTARKLKSELKKLFAQHDFSSAVVTMSSPHVEFMNQSRFFAQECETIWHNKRIYLVPSENIKLKGFTVLGSNSSALSLPQDARLLY